VQGVIVDSSKGYFQYLNDLSDRVIPELNLKPFEQVVLNRLYRLSRGWKSEECTVGLGALAKQCVMSRTSVQKSIGILVEKGLIEDLGEDKKGGKEGKRYRVLPGMTISPRTIPKDTIVKDVETIVSDTTEVPGTIPSATTNKDNNKDLINTHSNTDGVRGGSKFSIEECRRYAEHLRSTGQGINNPGGYATTIHRTGEADLLIESFLHPEVINAPSNLDTTQCPDCQGTGFYYPRGVEGGVARCKHEQLKEGK
jgi:predicted transcriptional regulator